MTDRQSSHPEGVTLCTDPSRNEGRAERALDALRTYCDRDGLNRADILAAPGDNDDRTTADIYHEVVSDLLCDLMHLADKLGVDNGSTEKTPRRAQMNELVDRSLHAYLDELEEG